MRYKKVSLNNPDLREGQDPRIDSAGLLYGSSQLEIPVIGFGSQDPAFLNLTEADYAAWHQRILHLPEVHRFRIHDAVVHPPYGIITIDGSVLEETLGHIPFHFPGYAQSDQEMTLPWEKIGGSFKEALHVMGGNYMNHYHWLLDIIPKLQVQPLSSLAFAGTVLMSPATSAAQLDMLMRLLQSNLSILSLAGSQATHVEALSFVPNLVGHGFAPNPGLASFIDHLRKFLGVDKDSVRRIYVARKDSQNRLLTNEDEVIAIAQRYGFEPVHLASLTLADQANLFASASHIIAPHGAGLANLIFCNPGVSICELHMEGYLNWCFRRLGGVRGVNYGCIIGTREPSEHTWPHHQRWSVPLMQVEAVLNDRQFMDSMNV